MRVCRPLAISLAVHAALLALLAAAHRRARTAPDEPALAIEVETAAAERAAPAAPEEVPDPPAVAKAEPRRAARRMVRAAAPPGGGAMGETGLGLGAVLGPIGGAGGGGAGGLGGGGQGGGGRVAKAAPVRPPRPVSRARPPRLVYPRRFRDDRDGEVFVALLTIDEDGWVVGARLLQGVNPHADARAMEAVWRFHYDPALDRGGRPIRARIRQPFMVE